DYKVLRVPLGRRDPGLLVLLQCRGCCLHPRPCARLESTNPSRIVRSEPLAALGFPDGFVVEPELVISAGLSGHRSSSECFSHFNFMGGCAHPENTETSREARLSV